MFRYTSSQSGSAVIKLASRRGNACTTVIRLYTQGRRMYQALQRTITLPAEDEARTGNGGDRPRCAVRDSMTWFMSP